MRKRYRIEFEDGTTRIVPLARPASGGVWLYEKDVEPEWVPNRRIQWIRVLRQEGPETLAVEREAAGLEPKEAS